MASIDSRSSGATGVVPVVCGAVTHLGATEAAAVDAQLMDPEGPYRFTLQQLMELAGLAVAQAVFDFAAASSREGATKRYVIVCGPGNNGGDGIVAARHLAMFAGSGAAVELVLPKPPKQPYFEALIAQAKGVGVTVGSEIPPADELRSPGVVIVDAIFGFSFAGAPRAPYDAVIAAINAATDPATAGAARLCCVDIPSGWHVDTGFSEATTPGALRFPAMLVSLTLPKAGVAAAFSPAGGLAHYVGGRFVPSDMARRWSMPEYPGSSQVVRLSDAKL